MLIGTNIGPRRYAASRRGMGVRSFAAGLALVKQMSLKAALLISFLGLAPVSAQTSDRPDGMRFLPDVPGQFASLTERADALGFHISSSPNPSACKHYQAITRVDGANGTPFFLVTRSGILPDTIPVDPGLFCDDSPSETDNGNLIVFKMGSRDKNGERLRSNRLRKGQNVDGTPPPPEDVATIYFTVVDGGLVFRDGEGTPPQKVYQHPGGMQLIGNILAIAVESPRDPLAECIGVCLGIPICIDFCNDNIHYEVAPNPTLIMFFDVSDPEAPVFKSQFAPVAGQLGPLTKAGVVGVTPLPGGRYLMAVTGGDPDDERSGLSFFRSTSGDLASPDLGWEFVRRTPGPNVEDAHQTLQFLREGNINGQLYLAGARGHAVVGPFFDDRDRIDLYTVDCQTPDCEPSEFITLGVRFNGRRITPRPSTGGALLANLAAATGFHITPSGELIFYATQHDNDGPDETAEVGEWRHIDMVREGSPTLLPSVLLNVPFEVDEGRATDLRGRAEPPITKPWIQLFEEIDFGGPHFSTLYPVVDFDDYSLDDFDDFFTLEPQIQFNLGNPPTFSVFTHNDKARSWKYFAPVGCSILTIDTAGGGFHARILNGTGSLEEDPDLSQNLPDMNEQVDAVEFRANCDDYYATEIDLQWDLDGSGSYETTGNVVSFDAAGLDGPSVVDVPVQAQHPFGGSPGQTIARVTVRNVAPRLTPLSLTDGAGNEVNVDVPFMLTGLPLTVSATFVDPGLADHQTATLAWGDGSTDAESAFTSFDEAFGDGTGAVSHTHRYTLAGSYPIALSVLDDDGGVGTESTVARVVTPEQAVAEILGLLDGVIAGTTDNSVLKELQKARKALAGSLVGESANGALAMIKAGNDPSAIAFLLQQAIFRLQLAQAGGADVATLIALLEQVIAALAAA
ncbi:MAG: hypothetical protein Q7R41_11645 [Phycisphaerales bacterium]|nr:hypothetical protein [Phycisphaerales bacterium]